MMASGLETSTFSQVTTLLENVCEMMGKRCLKRHLEDTRTPSLDGKPSCLRCPESTLDSKRNELSQLLRHALIPPTCGTKLGQLHVVYVVSLDEVPQIYVPQQSAQGGSNIVITRETIFQPHLVGFRPMLRHAPSQIFNQVSST